jgi:putative glutamine amidotransferase
MTLHIGRPAYRPTEARKPVMGVLCCNEVFDRPIQSVASRFIAPLASLSDVTVLLVPAVEQAFDAISLVDRLDGLLLTGSRSNVAGDRYGQARPENGALDLERDEVALTLAAHMIESGRPVFGICRGFQELNVLFGGTLARIEGDVHHRTPSPDLAFTDLFDHHHDVELTAGGLLSGTIGMPRLAVNSVHGQGVDRLGGGLAVEAIACDDGLVEAFSARPCGAPVVAVQWHPEWQAAHRPEGRAFFRLIGDALHQRIGVAPALHPDVALPIELRSTMAGPRMVL